MATESRLVDAETLAAALRATGALWSANDYYEVTTDADEFAAAILTAIPPDPRLDALLAVARWAAQNPKTHREYLAAAARDALAAFDEKA